MVFNVVNGFENRINEKGEKELHFPNWDFLFVEPNLSSFGLALWIGAYADSEKSVSAPASGSRVAS